MGETIGGWQRTHEVHMDVAEPLSRDRNDVDGRLNMPDHLGALAVEARPGPNPNVCVHGGPEETCRNQPPRSTNSRVRKTVKKVESLPTKLQR